MLKGFLKNLAHVKSESEILTGGIYFQNFTTHYFKVLNVFSFFFWHCGEQYRATAVTILASLVVTFITFDLKLFNSIKFPMLFYSSIGKKILMLWNKNNKSIFKQ